MGGTRYNSRGIDNNGHVANFVESEQILITPSYLFSFIQIRGSLPFYWEQKGLKAKINIHQTISINQNNFNSHLKFLKEELGLKNILFLNLLGVKRGQENTLTDYFCEIFRKSKQNGVQNVFYEHIDFHAITNETDFSNVDQYVYKHLDDKIGFNKYEYDVIDGEFNQIKH